jgi:hypothetical protein
MHLGSADGVTVPLFSRLAGWRLQESGMSSLYRLLFMELANWAKAVDGFLVGSGDSWLFIGFLSLEFSEVGASGLGCCCSGH